MSHLCFYGLQCFMCRLPRLITVCRDSAQPNPVKPAHWRTTTTENKEQRNKQYNFVCGQRLVKKIPCNLFPAKRHMGLHSSISEAKSIRNFRFGKQIRTASTPHLQPSAVRCSTFLLMPSKLATTSGGCQLGGAGDGPDLTRTLDIAMA